MLSQPRIATLLLFLSLPTSNGAGQGTALPEITAASDTAWHDLTFRVQQRGRLPEGGQLLRVAGAYRQKPVALAVLLGPAWTAGHLGNLTLVTYSGTVTLRSLGEESDRLLRAIDELYGTRQRPQKMRQQTQFTAITLGGDPRHLEAGPVKIKLLFESNDESQYAELYLNIDLGRGSLELAEKDPDYRTAIVRALRVP